MARVPSLGLGKNERIDFFFREYMKSLDQSYLRRNDAEQDVLVCARSAMVFLLFCDLVRQSYHELGGDFQSPAIPF